MSLSAQQPPENFKLRNTNKNYLQFLDKNDRIPYLQKIVSFTDQAEFAIVYNTK